MPRIARSAVLVGFDNLCRDLALNPNRLLPRCGLDPLLLRRMDLYLPYARFAQALTLAAREGQCSDFGLRLSEYHDYLVLGPFGLLLSQAESFADVLKLTQQYVHLHAQGISMTPRLDSQQLQVDYCLDLQEEVDLRQLLELGVGVMHRSMRSLFGSQWQPRRVLIQHACQGEPATYEHFFGCPVAFGQPVTAIICDPQALALKPLEQRQQLKSHLLEQYARRHQVEPGLSAQIRLVLQSILSTGEASLPVVARLLDRHPRSLQQVLQSQGTSFRQLLDEVRYGEALQQLRQSNQSITDLALNLGYADETAFSRAFRRWSGQSPRSCRAEARHQGV